MEQEASEVILFFGRFHPLLLHLPIGFLVMAFLLEAFSRLNKFRPLKAAVGFVLLLGAVSAVVTAGLGYMLAQAGGYDEQLLSIHQWTGIALAFTAVAVFGLHRLLQAKPSAVLDKIYGASLVVMMIFLAVAGHFGGSLTHGSDYLTAYMPDGLRKMAGLPPRESRYKKITNLKEAVVFDDIVYPILDTRCVSCHNKSKSKGDLILDSREALLKGGEGGAIVVPGDPQASEMIKRVHLPISDDDHMPPDGKKQLTDDQMALLSWWIREGAPFNKTVAEVTVDDQVQAILHTLADPDANKSEVELLLAGGVQPAEKQKLLALNEKGIAVIPLARDHNWLQARVPQNYPTDSLIKDLLGLADQITWLDLGATGITDEALGSIGRFRNLTRLHLENTRVTDQGLQYLKGLKYLEYLNLYGTEVTDEGVKQLAGLKNLRNLYIWQTGVSQEGILLLRESLPALEVHTGMEISGETLTFSDQ